MTPQPPSRRWMIWAFVPLFSGISFVLAGRRAKERTWEIGGWVLIAFTVLALALSDTEKPRAVDPYDIVMGFVMGGWLAAMVAVYLIRPRYERQMLVGQDHSATEARRAVSPVTDAAPPASSPHTSSQAPTLSGPPPMSIPSGSPQPASITPPLRPAPATPEQTERELTSAGLPAEPVDLNSASAAQLAALPGMTSQLAERAIGYREARGGFRDLRDFVAAAGLQPHHAEQLRERTRVTSQRSARSRGDKGRVLDL